jgi:hypothetical protein
MTIKDFEALSEREQLSELLDALDKMFGKFEKNPVNPQITDAVTQIKNEFTFGQKLVGLNFNPSGDPRVQRIKTICAELADIIEAHNKNIKSGNDISYIVLNSAISKILEAQMMAVKFITLK